jgi:heat shock protein HslJ
MKPPRTQLRFLIAILLPVIADRAQVLAQDAVGDLGGTSWQLVQFQGSDDTTLTPDDKSKYTIAFEKDGSVSLRIDCNRGRGTWKSSGPNQIEFGPMALTRAMCPPAPLTDRIPRDWEHIRSYVLKDTHLFLALMADAGIYEFEPVGADNKTAKKLPDSVHLGAPATFVGTLPCADCPGIHYQLNLHADHTFASSMTYEERKGSFDECGTWHLENSGKTLVLQGSKAREQLALLDRDTLRKLDANGNEIESKLNYDLKRAPKFTPIEQSGQGVSDASLENTEWKLTRLGDAPVTSASQKQEANFTLNSEAHRISGSGGCNRLTGRYELHGDRITFSQMAGTMMACVQGMETEKAFLDALKQATRWKITGQQLELFDDTGRQLANFAANDQK